MIMYVKDFIEQFGCDSYAKVCFVERFKGEFHMMQADDDGHRVVDISHILKDYRTDPLLKNILVAELEHATIAPPDYPFDMMLEIKF